MSNQNLEAWKRIAKRVLLPLLILAALLLIGAGYLLGWLSR